MLFYKYLARFQGEANSTRPVSWPSWTSPSSRQPWAEFVGHGSRRVLWLLRAQPQWCLVESPATLRITTNREYGHQSSVFRDQQYDKVPLRLTRAGRLRWVINFLLCPNPLFPQKLSRLFSPHTYFRLRRAIFFYTSSKYTEDEVLCSR